MTKRDLATNGNLFDFFHERVEAAAESRGRPVSQDGVFYLTNLLVERARARPEQRGTTLVELHIEAQRGTRVQAIAAYRDIGDKALIVTGFFRDSLQRQTVGVNYYMEMGAAAYDRLARLLQAPGGQRGLDAVFEELARTFPACSELLREVRQDVQAHSDRDILRLYEQWLATGDARLAERLRELGVLPRSDEVA